MPDTPAPPEETLPARRCCVCGQTGSGSICSNTECGGLMLREGPFSRRRARIDEGTVIGDRYSCVECIGCGSFGEVWSAYDQRCLRDVALKVIPWNANEGFEKRRRIGQELRALARVAHPVSLTLHDWGELDDGAVYIVTDLLSGATLDEHREKTCGFTAIDPAEICIDLLRALHEAHVLGIVHRDVKPRNVILQQIAGGQQVTRLLDFGVAHIAMAAGANRLTADGAVLGTPAYAAPEQLRGEKKVTPAIDVYAVGTILFELVSGERPYPQNKPMAILYAKNDEDAPLLEDRHVVGLHDMATLSDLVAEMLARDPEQRPEAGKAADRLADWLRGAGAGPARGPGGGPAGGPAGPRRTGRRGPSQHGTRGEQTTRKDATRRDREEAAGPTDAPRERQSVLLAQLEALLDAVREQAERERILRGRPRKGTIAEIARLEYQLRKLGGR